MTLTEKRLHWILTKLSYGYALKGFLCILATYCHVHSECWPTNETLARRGGITERTVTNYLRLLESDGLISVTYGKRPRGKSTGRILHLHFPGEETSGHDPKPSGGKSRPRLRTDFSRAGGKQEIISGRGGGQNVAPREAGGNDFRAGGETVSAGGAKSFPAEEVLESKEPKSKKNLIQGRFSAERQEEPQRKATAAPLPGPSAEGLSGAPEKETLDPLCAGILEIYRAVCTGLKPADRFPEKGRQAVEKVISTYPQARSREWWQAYFERAARSKLLNGGGKRGWRASLGWLLVPWTVKLVLEGHYDDSLGLCG